MQTILSNPATLTTLIGILGMFFAYLKGTKWWQDRVAANNATAIDAIMAGVISIAQTYISNLKPGVDGKISDADAAKARDLARAAAIEIAKTKGVDLVKTLGDDAINHWIEVSVAKNKMAMAACAKH